MPAAFITTLERRQHDPFDDGAQDVVAGQAKALAEILDRRQATYRRRNRW